MTEMFNRLKHFLSPPTFEDEETTRLARLLFVILRAAFVASLTLTPTLTFLAGGDEPLPQLAVGAVAAVLILGLFGLMRTGRVRTASVLLPSAFLALLTVSLFRFGDIHGPITAGYYLVILVAGLLLGRRWIIAFTLFSILATLGVLLISMPGASLTSPEGVAQLRAWVVHVGLFSITAALLSVAARNSREGLDNARRLVAELRNRERLAEALRRVGAAVTASLDLPTVLAAVCAETRAAFDADGVAVWLLADDAATLQVVAAHGQSADRLLGEHVPLDEPISIVARAVRERRPIFVNDLQRAGDGVPRLNRVTGAQALLVTPIVKEAHALGVLAVFDTRRPQRFGPEDVAAAELLGAQLAVAIQNARLFEEAQRKTLELAGLYDAALATSGTLDTQALLTRLYEHVRRIMAPDSFGVFLYRAVAEELEVALAMESGEAVPGAVGQRFPLREAGLTGWLIHSGQPLLVHDMQSDPLPVAPRHITQPARSWLGVPLLAREHVIGAVTLQSFRPRAFAEADRRFLESVAGQIAIALENARLFAEMQRRAEQMALLNDLTRAALETADLPQMLQMLADRLSELINADGCYLTLWDEARQAVIPASASGAARETYWTLRVEPDDATMTASVLRAGRALVAEDVFNSPHISPRIAAQFPTRSLLGLPLMAGGQKLGAALIGFNQPHHFTADEIALGEQAARQIALALAKARALESERKRSAELETLRQASLRLSSQLELQPVLQIILEQAMRLMSASNANLFLYDGERLTFGAALGFEGLTRKVYSAPRAEGVTHAVARSGERIVIPDVNRHPLYQDWQWGGAIISLPLAIGGQMRGVMNIAFDQPRSFDENELRVLDLLADQAAAALEQARLFEAERRRAAQLGLLEEVSREAAGTLDEQEIFRRTVTAIVNRFGFAEAAVSLPVGDDELELAAITGTEDMGFAPGFRQKVGQGIIGHVAASRAVYVAGDLLHDPYYYHPRGPRAGSAVGLPMLREGELVGVLYVESSASGAFEADDVRTLETLANHVATAAQNARLYAQARDRLREMAALQSVSQTVASSLEPRAILYTVIQLLQDTFGYHYVSIYLLDGDVLRLGAQVGYPAELTYHEIPITSGITGRTVRTRQTQFVQDVTADPEFLLARYDLGSEICVPLLKEQTVLGVLNVESTHDRPLTETDVGLLTALAGPVTVAIDNARLFESERKQRELAEALRDALGAGAALSGSLDMETVLDRLLDQVAHVVEYDAANIMLVEEQTGRTRMARTRGYERFGDEVARETATLSFEVAKTENLRRMAETGQPLVIPDTAAFPGWVRVKVTDYVRSWAGAPIMAQGRAMAFFSISKREPNFYRPEDAARLAAFAGLAALAIQNARLFEQTRRRAEMLAALHATSLDITLQHDLPTLLRTIVERAARLLNAPGGGLYLCDPQRQEVRNVVSYNTLRDYTGTVLKYGEGAAGIVAQTGQPLIIDDYRRWSGRASVYEEDRPFSAVVSAPMIWQGQVIGVIHVLHSVEGQRFTPADLELLTLFANQAAVAVENARLLAETQRRAEQLSALNEVGRAVSTLRDVESVLGAIFLQVQRVLPLDVFFVSLYDPETNMVSYPLVFDGGRRYQESAKPLIEESHTGHTLRTAAPQLINCSEEELAAKAHHRHGIGDKSRPSASMLFAPLMVGARIIGVISAQSYSLQTYTEEHLTLLIGVASQAATAIENARLFEAEQRRAEEQHRLFSAARDFGAGLSEEAVLQAVVRHMVTALDAAGCSVSLWEPEHDRVVTLIHYDSLDTSNLDRPGTAYALADYPATRRVLETRQPVALRVDDPEADPAEVALLVPQGIVALVMFALTAGSQVFGLIEISRRSGAPPFSESDIRLGQSLAAQAAVALENARLHGTVRERVRELDALLTANTAMLSTLELDPLLDNILRAAVAAIPAAEKGTILLLEAAEPHDALEARPSRLQIRAIYGYTDPRVQTFTFAGSEGYSAKAVREKRPLLIPDARADPEIRYDGDIFEVRAIQSGVVAPLMHHDQPVGVIALDSTRRAAFTEADLRLLMAFANTAAVAIDNARLHAEVRALAVTDGLTGLTNHRAFHHALEVEVARAGRYGYPVSLVFLDIDSFKLYNDTYGHPAGNERLKAIAALLQERVREPDVAARYGGEEFAIILPHTPKVGALHLAERIRAAAEATAPEAHGPGVPFSGYTLSLGVAGFPEDARNAEDLLLAADDAELAAKRAGKNRVVAAPPLAAP
jgi:diguanylate cyclase (GGDEF)-like protein